MSPDPQGRLSAAVGSRYEIERELGRGGMAEVFLARDLKHDRKVAVKVLRPELTEAVGAERFLAEIKLTAQLQHPHILPLHDSGESDGCLYYVMPYAEGEALRDRMEREKKLPISEAVEIIRAIAGALDYAHRHDVVHRDIKPENVLLVDGQAVVADFGIALAVDAAGVDRLTSQGLSIGTPTYMSPEQATGEPVDGRSDIYSLACVLYEMLAGQPPHSDTTVQGLVAKLLTERPVQLRLMRETVSPELDDVVMTALAKVPADRFQTAAAFADALGAALASSGRPRRVLPAVPLVAAAAAVAAVAGVAAYVASRPGGPAPMPVREEAQLTFDGNVMGSALSPDGEFLTWVSGDDDDPFYRLYVKEVGGANAVLLDSLAELMCCATWSPDGSEIVYQRGTRSTGTTVITPRLGGPRREIPAEVAFAWAPDGSRILSWWPAARELTITDPAKAAIVGTIPLGDGHDWVNAADWSPDGRFVAVAIQDSLQFRIRTLELDGRVIEELVADTTQVLSPEWARDGSGIYYVHGDAIWKVGVGSDGRAASEPRMLLGGVETFAQSTTMPRITVSVDGSRLAYNRFVGHANLWRFSQWDESGGEPAERVPLTQGTASRTLPRLSPDGSRLAYVEAIDDRSNVYVMPAAGGAPRQLTFFQQSVWSPVWSPDGSTIAVGAIEGGERGLWLFDVASGSRERVPVASFRGDEMEWAPRNDIIYQVRDHTELRVIDPGSGRERVLLAPRPSTWWYDLRLTPDGTGLYLRRTGRGPSLWEVEVASGDVRPVSTAAIAAVTGGGGVPGLLAMTVDGRQNVGRDLFRVGPDGAATRYLTLPLGQGVNPMQVTMAPDGRSLIASVPVFSTDVWLVENFDPR